MRRRSWRRFLRRIVRGTPQTPAPQIPDIEHFQLALGRQESRIVKSGRYERLRDAEFRVFSQFGEDGIIQYLISKVPIEHDVFVEFGVRGLQRVEHAVPALQRQLARAHPRWWHPPHRLRSVE